MLGLQQRSEGFPSQGRKDLVIEDFDQTYDRDSTAGWGGAVEAALCTDAHSAITTQVREPRSEPKVGESREPRCDQGLRVIELGVGHQVHAWAVDANGLDEAIEVSKRVFEFEVGENVAIRRPLDSACIASLGLYRQRTQVFQCFPIREIFHTFADKKFAAEMSEA